VKRSHYYSKIVIIISDGVYSRLFYAVEKCSVCACCYDVDTYIHDNSRYGHSVTSRCYSVYSALPVRHIRVPGVASVATAVQKV